MPNITDLVGEPKDSFAQKKLPELPSLGSRATVTDDALLRRIKGIVEPGKRLLLDRNFDPEVTRAVGRAFPALRKSIRKGKLNFHIEIPKVNSGRAFISFNYTL